MSMIKTLSESQTASFIRGTVFFMEAAASDSRVWKTMDTLLNKAYPKWLFDLFDSANKKQQSYLSRNIFSPILIFPIIYALFISISDYRLSNLAILTVAVGLTAYLLGYRVSRLESKRVRWNKRTRDWGVFFFLTGLIFLVADLYGAEAIPLFDPSGRSRLNVTYTMLAQLIPPGTILIIAYIGEAYNHGSMELKKARIQALTIFFLGMLLISTLGFRTQIIVALLGSFIAMYLSGLVGFVEVLSILGLAGLAIVLLGYMRALIQHSPIGIFDVLGARVGLTLSVFDHLVTRFMPFGANKGYTFLASFSSLIPGLPGPRMGPRTIVARLFGVIGISMTSTLLGTIVLDLGIIGVILFMFLLGHVLGTAYRAAKTGSAMAIGIYSVLLAYTLVGIETGIVDFNVLMMFFAGYLLLRNPPTDQ